MSGEAETIINEAIDGAEAVRDPLDALVEKAATDPGAPFEPEALALLITLKRENAAAFERLRSRFAKETDVRLGELDKLLAKTGEAKELSGQGQALIIDEPEPWDSTVHGAILLDDIATALKSYVILPDRARRP